MKHSILALGVIAGVTACARADIVEFTIYENASGGDISGLLLTVELIDAGSGIDFVFRNQSTTSSVIASIYFEDTDAISGMLLNGTIAGESAGVDFGDGATPNNPAQAPASAGGPWDGTLYSAGAEPPPTNNGINEVGNEWLSIHFDYGGGGDFDAIATALTSDPAGFRIAMHILSVGDDAFSVWGNTVPAPGSTALLALGGLVALRRRR